MNTLQILIRPIITEKSMKGAKSGKYTFQVNRLATKKDIKNAVEKEFDVSVTSVFTLMTKGRSKRVGPRRKEVTQSPIKKAVVKVKEGQKIGFFDLGAEEK